MKKLSVLGVGILIVFSLSLGKPATTEPTATNEIVQQKEIPHPGEALYTRYCLACHQADGNGVPGMHPTLVETDWVLGDKERLIDIILNGMKGAVIINGEEFNSIMAPMSFINDQDITDILTYVRSSFGNDASEVTAGEVAEVRAEKAE